MSTLATIVDKIYAENGGLMPVFSWIETEDIAENDYATGQKPTPWTPTPAQVNMLVWINLVHGVKGINWFPGQFGNTPDYNYVEMHRIYLQLTALTDVILGPDVGFAVSDNSNIEGNRVDTMVRKNGTDIWLFAVRLTEISSSGVPEQNDIQTTFTIPNFGSGSVMVYDEGRSLSVSNGQFTDTFVPNAVHIYKISSNLGASPSGGILESIINWIGNVIKG